MCVDEDKIQMQKNASLRCIGGKARVSESG